MRGKTSAETRVCMPVYMMPQDANPSGNVHGGAILRLLDCAASIVAQRHANSSVVTAAIEHMDFLAPAFVGEVVFFKANLNFVGRTSMCVGVRVDAENPHTGEVRHTGSAFLTFVALDENSKPRPVPPLILVDEVDQRRYEAAKKRRELRLRIQKEI